MTDDSDSALRPGKPAWAPELSEREWLFCEQFAGDLNATEAAVRAGYGKTRKRAKEQASKLRRNPRIAATISRLVAGRAGVTQTTLLAELGAIARSRVTDVLEVKGGDLIVKDLSELTDEQLGAIEAIEEVLGQDGAKTLKVKFGPAQALLPFRPTESIQHQVLRLFWVKGGLSRSSRACRLF